MPKKTYVPTETDRLTGVRVRQLRKQAGETIADTLAAAGLPFSQQTLSRIELGERHLSIPEATKLAAHFNTTVDRVIIKAPTVETEQHWLGNEPALAVDGDDKNLGLFAVPNTTDYTRDELDALAITERTHITIDRDNPLTPDEYRAQVWVPYLEARYTTDQKAS
jgi:transcriptional regulator with XRE-family HTH domain